MIYDTPRLRAKTAGLKRYEGLPCNKCGGTTRLVSNQQCVPCRQAQKYAARKKKQTYAKRGRPKQKPLTEEELELKKERVRQYQNAYAASPERRGYKRAKRAKRRCDTLNRTPKWLTKEDKQAIKQIYELAVTMSTKLGIEHHVDHIIPLRGKYVSGLHVPANLQVLSASENLKKLANYTVE